MAKFTKGFEYFTIVCVVFGAIALVVLTMATIVDVTLRAVFVTGMDGTIELVSALLTPVVYFGAGYCTLKKGLIVVELFKSPRPIVIFNDILCVIIGLLIAYYSVIQGLFSMKTGMSSMMMNIPKWPFMFITAFGFVVMSIAIVVNLINDQIDRKKGIAKSSLDAAIEDAEKSIHISSGGGGQS